MENESQEKVMVTAKTRQKFRTWKSELDKLTEKEKQDEAGAWIKAALMILDENSVKESDEL